ncbi:Gypsy retrotransposon integrase-like protein 1 [Cucumis melo var. makuwa]|uniref:Gypsy retrotransposon integrase-like protein 1 n=1 Tax=Cucumis melo var. makuwa TaxID=1194695 RepID=A0A5A7VK50_CUCMM|nr:Gypsy retrotransposon integrase-like protein 1 [Cucumis melo var. makuwa]TYK15154.1 Gypsy retrotransposon integrase-like protein 1 [Cucumis melo var. makuwa]
MDVIGPVDPKASNGYRFILVAIDHFTKWIKVPSYCNVTRGVVLKFIKKELICRYGLPEGIITDNAKNLNNKMMDELYVEIPSLRVLKKAKLHEAEWIRGRYKQLNFVEEKQLAALSHG